MKIALFPHPESTIPFSPVDCSSNPLKVPQKQWYEDYKNGYSKQIHHNAKSSVPPNQPKFPFSKNFRTEDFVPFLDQLKHFRSKVLQILKSVQHFFHTDLLQNYHSFIVVTLKCLIIKVPDTTESFFIILQLIKVKRGDII